MITAFPDLAANNGPKRFHHNRAVQWLMSKPRSNRRSSTRLSVRPKSY